jgi:heme-degrading monooxygenase HmoA
VERRIVTSFIWVGGLQMAYATRAEIPGMTRDQYNGMFQQVSPRLKTQPGFVFHMSGPADGCYYAIEVWESEAAHQAWIRDVIEPAARAGGMALGPMQPLAVENVVQP